MVATYKYLGNQAILLENKKQDQSQGKAGLETSRFVSTVHLEESLMSW